MTELDSTIKVTGALELILVDRFGLVKQHQFVNNLVVTTGRSLIASRLVNATDAVPGWMEVGTDSTAAAAAQTGLLAAVAASRTALTGTSRSSNVITYSATFNAGVGTGVLREAGIFNASTAGTMLCRTVFSTITKDAADVLTINWNVTIN